MQKEHDKKEERMEKAEVNIMKVRVKVRMAARKAEEKLEQAQKKHKEDEE